MNDIFKMNQKNNETIKLETDLDSQTINIFGLYDPEDYNKLNMSNSDGDQLKNIFVNLVK